MILVGCYVVIVVWYRIENLRLAPMVAQARHEHIKADIARLEQDLYPDLPTT